LESAFDLVQSPPERSLTDTEREFLNYLEAFDAFDDLRGDKSYPVSRRDLCNLHRLIVAEVRGGHTNAGRVRESEVVIGDRQGDDIVVHHAPPEPHEVTPLLDALTDWLGRVKTHPTPRQIGKGVVDAWMHPVIAAGIAQHRVVWIHPFLDGNGRTARMFTTMLLYQRGYDFKYLFDLSSYYNRDRDAYYTALRTADETGDYTRWLEYFLGGFAYQLFGIKTRAQELGKGLAVAPSPEPDDEEPSETSSPTRSAP
jgi:Fic family protein